MIGASEETFKGTNGPEKKFTPIFVCVFVCGGDGWRDHTKILPGHVTEARMNGAFWLVGEGSHGNRSIVPLSNWEALCICACFSVCWRRREAF